MTDTDPTIDGREHEARRVATLVMTAIINGDNRAAADLIKTFDNPREAWLSTAALAAEVLRDRSPESQSQLLSAWAWEGLRDWYDDSKPPMERARSLIEEELSDGKPHSYVRIRALALSKGINTKALSNAARYLGVESKNQNTGQHTWRLPRRKTRA